MTCHCNAAPQAVITAVIATISCARWCTAFDHSCSASDSIECEGNQGPLQISRCGFLRLVLLHVRGHLEPLTNDRDPKARTAMHNAPSKRCSVAAHRWFRPSMSHVTKQEPLKSTGQSREMWSKCEIYRIYSGSCGAHAHSVAFALRSKPRPSHRGQSIQGSSACCDCRIPGMVTSIATPLHFACFQCLQCGLVRKHLAQGMAYKFSRPREYVQSPLPPQCFPAGLSRNTRNLSLQLLIGAPSKITEKACGLMMDDHDMSQLGELEALDPWEGSVMCWRHALVLPSGICQHLTIQKALPCFVKDRKLYTIVSRISFPVS